MSEIQVKERDIVAPGETLATGMDVVPGVGTYRSNDTIVAGRLGLVQLEGKAIKLIPLSGNYAPKKYDTIICRVTDIMMSGWMMDTGSAYQAMLGLKEGSSEFIAKGADLSQYYNIGDHVVCKIINISNQKFIDVSIKGPGLRRLKGGRIIKISSNKVPRVIGKQGSMISMIKDATGCNITVGQNGRVWIDGSPENELLAIKAIRKIEEDSIKSGLTDSIKAFLEEHKVK